jgi:PKD domain
VIPYNAVLGHCQSANPRPNHSTADPAISTISHEHNEMVTDPDEDAWIDAYGEEDGDLCITAYGPRLGGSGGSMWDQSIHGHHYWVQEEWSNFDNGCRPRARPDLAYFGAPSPVFAGRALSLTAQSNDRNGPIIAYDWFFSDGGHGHRRQVSHQFHAARSYRVMLRTTDSLGLYALYTRVVKVQPPGKAHRAKRHSH